MLHLPMMTRRQAILALAAADSTQTLFDGRSFNNFRTPTGITTPAVSWIIHDRILETIPDARRQCDLWTAADYENFDLQFDWKMGHGGNSGIKYLIQASSTDKLRDAKGEFLHEATLGFEFQLADDTSPAIGNNPLYVSGALYNYLPASALAAHAPGKWNGGRLLVDGNQVEHWINGKRVLAYTIGSPELTAALGAKKLNSARLLERLTRRKTPIAFQHHESSAAFRNIKIRMLAGPKSQA